MAAVPVGPYLLGEDRPIKGIDALGLSFDNLPAELTPAYFQELVARLDLDAQLDALNR